MFGKQIKRSLDSIVTALSKHRLFGLFLLATFILIMTTQNKGGDPLEIDNISIANAAERTIFLSDVKIGNQQQQKGYSRKKIDQILRHLSKIMRKQRILRKRRTFPSYPFGFQNTGGNSGYQFQAGDAQSNNIAPYPGHSAMLAGSEASKNMTIQQVMENLNISGTHYENMTHTEIIGNITRFLSPSSLLPLGFDPHGNYSEIPEMFRSFFLRFDIDPKLPIDSEQNEYYNTFGHPDKAAGVRNPIISPHPVSSKPTSQTRFPSNPDNRNKPDNSLTQLQNNLKSRSNMSKMDISKNGSYGLYYFGSGDIGLISESSESNNSLLSSTYGNFSTITVYDTSTSAKIHGTTNSNKNNNKVIFIAIFVPLTFVLAIVIAISCYIRYKKHQRNQIIDLEMQKEGKKENSSPDMRGRASGTSAVSLNEVDNFIKPKEAWSNSNLNEVTVDSEISL